MPPKRKAAAKGKAKAGGKKAKVVEDEEPAAPATVKDAIKVLKNADKGKIIKSRKVDDHCPLAAGQVYQDYDCMLNQTNIGFNNNKYYIIQVLQYGGNAYYIWNRWGRVGEPGQNKLAGPMELDAARKDFEKKFKDKTRNAWEKRAKFVPSPGKYTLLEMEGGDEEGDDDDVVDAGPSVKVASGLTDKCTLDKPTQDLLNMIFNNDMFQHAMKKMDIDVKKMPLGKLSKTQIAKGFECLEEIEDAVKKGASKAKLSELSSRFYTLIPHSFGRTVPPSIADLETVQGKFDMLLVLGDIELAQTMQKEQEKMTKANKADLEPHPLDCKYKLLKCDLEHMKPNSADYKEFEIQRVQRSIPMQVLDNYLTSTRETDYQAGLELLDLWKINRYGEHERFKAHDGIDNRKLLWHGTNVAVVAAIMQSGLRIMPHSGGRVGRGIYFASENSKSAGYVGTDSENVGIMFLNEVALGKEKSIQIEGSDLVAAPAGFNSVVARGRTEPDPRKNTSLTLDGKKVVVPLGKPVLQATYSKSNFDQSEYLIYKESQCQMRYLLKLQF